MSLPNHVETLTHRLILPRDANHYGTLFAGSLLALTLEAGYAAAHRTVGSSANLVLKRVLDLRCYEPVPVGHVVEIRGKEVRRARAMVVIALYGTPLIDQAGPWMDSLMQFVQVDAEGRPDAIDGEVTDDDEPLNPPWCALQDRARKLIAVRN